MTLVIAHRGLVSRCPENTLLAFTQAFALGVDGAALDIRLSADGVPVVFRDENLRRVTGVDLPLCELTVRELKTLDTAHRFRGQCPAQPIATLEEYCALVRKRNLLSVLELRTLQAECEGIERSVVDMIDAFRLNDRVILTSQNHYTLLRVKALAPDLPLGVRYECRLAEPQQYASSLGMQYLLPNHLFLNDTECEKYEAAGVKTLPYGAETEADLRRLMEQRNVYAVLTARPELAMALQKRK